MVLGATSLAKYGGGTTRFMHANPLGSTTMVTDTGGTVIRDELLYPWGQRWTCAGHPYDGRFASLRVPDSLAWDDPEGPLETAPFRTYHATLGRWLSSDPGSLGAAKLTHGRKTPSGPKIH